MACLTTIIESGVNGGLPVTYSICCSKTFAQTLFLGCSVKSFNASLAWGAESSRLSVELVYDPCPYPVLTDRNGVQVPRPPIDSAANDNAYINSLISNDFPKDENGNNLVPGKVYYVPKNSGLISRYYYDADPGFYADMPNASGNIDIIGTAVYFKYNDFEFNGIVKSWNNTGSNSEGTKKYNVDIESPAPLLSQTEMILGDYNGAIFVKPENDNTALFGFPKFEKGAYTGKIIEQNIPNLINVYGYLEDVTNLDTNLPVDENNIPTYSFGASRRNDDGLQALKIINAVQDLLNAPLPPGPSSLNQTLLPTLKKKIFRYSPFGRIVGLTPKRKADGKDFDDEPPLPYPIEKYRMGLIHAPIFYDGIRRLCYTVDITEINKDQNLPYYYRINQNHMNILDFVTDICNSTGKEFFISLDLQIINSIIYPRITVNTVNRLKQPVDGAVSSYINYLTGLGISVNSYTKGEEYNNTRGVRSVYIGGKQQRLYQVRNVKYSRKQTVLRYNPYNNTFMSIAHATSQDYRFPNPASTRNPEHYYNPLPAPSPSIFQNAFNRIELPVINNLSPFKFSDALNPAVAILNPSRKTVVPLGNYFKEINLSATGSFPDTSWYPASDSDAICPYFGTNDITGVVRKVYSHRTGFIIEFTTTEIGLAIGRTFSNNDTVGISETEIRAAMAGLDSYVGFISAVINDAVSILGPAGKGALQIWSKILVPLLGDGGVQGMEQGIAQVSNKLNNSQSGSSSVPIGIGGSFMSNPTVQDIIVKLHAYFKKIGDTYYGQKYMVSIPTPQYWTDRAQYSPPIQIGVDLNNQPIYLTEGTNKTYYSFEPTDFAWEEPGNYIDDSLLVGSPQMDPLTKDDNSIEPILGFYNSAQYNYPKAFNSGLWANSKINDYNEFFQFWKYQTYRNAGLFNSGTAPVGLPSSGLWEPVLQLDSNSENMSIVPYITDNVNGSMRPVPGPDLNDPFGTVLPTGYINKVYVKGTVDKQLQTYVTQGGQIVPKAIISTKPIHVNPLSRNALSVRCAVAEYLANDYGGSAAIVAAKILSTSDAFISFNTTNNNTVANATSQNTDNRQYTNMDIAPKAAVPSFAALPIILNNCVYGPWVSAPDIQRSGIFNNNYERRLENLVGGVKLEIQNDFVPWNYGGMRVLDDAVSMLVAQDNDYQTKSEAGQLVVFGTPQMKLGAELKSAAFAFRGPTINNVQVQISEGGPLTTYTFRTFTKKFTLFNKENADRLKTIGQNSVKFNKELRQQNRDIVNRLLTMSSQAFNTVSSYSTSRSKLTEFSPMSILVGYSSPYISPKISGTGYFFKPGNWSKDSVKQLTTVTLQDARELPQEFDHLYGAKSFMSLDGLLSPVSLYPTINNSTAPYKKYQTPLCPMCKGTKKYKYQTVELYCDYCTLEPPISTGLADFSSSSINGTLPPYIVTSGGDDAILRNPTGLKKLISEASNRKINYINLNPIIMPVGELRNQFAQSGDYNAHHIDIVGRSLVPMSGSLSINDNLAINQSGLEYKDQNDPLCYLDWNSNNFDKAAGLPQTLTLMNQRFLALRGPLVLAGWGYDTDGFPVPNASGEPKEIDASGYPKRIKDSKDATGGFVNYSGTILGKNQKFVSGEWTAPVKENSFMKGWGLRPDAWPVGPVDLRWDHDRKVWTAVGDDYSFVNIQLEDDLLPPFPARGYMNDIDKEIPLESGLRRMVFVKDPTEFFAVPRGAKILCYYNKGNGFYEPIGYKTIITSGIVNSNSSATIYNSYAKGYNKYTGEAITPDPLDVTYKNLLGFNIQSNQTGLFMFTTNGWILTSTASC